MDQARPRLLTDDTNAVFRVGTDRGAYVLRVGRGGAIGHSVGQVRSEVVWLAALAAESPARVPEPIPSVDGDLFVRVAAPGVPEKRTCVVFRWIPGTLLEAHLDEHHLEEYGALAALLHEHARTFPVGGDATSLRWDRIFPFDEPVVLFDDELPSRRRSLYRDAADLVVDRLAGLRASEPMRLIHGDLHVWNVLADRGTVAAIDFEDHMWGWPVQDLGVALYYLHGRPGFADMLAAIRRGYERVASWPAQREDDVMAFVAGRALVLANDVRLLDKEGEDDLDVAAFFSRTDRRLEAILAGRSFLP
jgi:Ser/Thr protein kinase RdoA (MazF antagonist)